MWKWKLPPPRTCSYTPRTTGGVCHTSADVCSFPAPQSSCTHSCLNLCAQPGARWSSALPHTFVWATYRTHAGGAAPPLHAKGSAVGAQCPHQRMRDKGWILKRADRIRPYSVTDIYESLAQGGQTLANVREDLRTFVRMVKSLSTFLCFWPEVVLVVE